MIHKTRKVTEYLIRYEQLFRKDSPTVAVVTIFLVKTD